MILKNIVTVITAALVAESVHANIVDMNNFRMNPFVLVHKQDFTYSSGSKEEDYSAIKFDLSLTPQHTDSSFDYALMIITADTDASNELVGLISNGTQQAGPSDTGVKRKQIEWVDDVETML